VQKYISPMSQISRISGSCFSTGSKVDSSRAANCPELEAGSDGKHQWFWIYYYLMQCNPTVRRMCICICMCVRVCEAHWSALQNLCAEIDRDEVKKWQNVWVKKTRENLKNICRIVVCLSSYFLLLESVFIEIYKQDTLWKWISVLSLKNSK